MLVFNGKPVRSGSVKAGDKLGEATVSSIHTIDRRGVFAPMTESGDIFVSEVLSSCFVAPLDISPAIEHLAAKAILSPLRLACLTSFDVCQNESYTKDDPIMSGESLAFSNSSKAFPDLFSSLSCQLFFLW